MRLFKAQALGNDYLIWLGAQALEPGLVRRLCDRHRGPGADGVLEPVASERADHGVRIWNPDGSVAEKSGNGLRILAHWLVHHRGAAARFTVDTGAEVVRCAVEAEGIAVAMGRASIRWVDRALEVHGDRLRTVAVSVGNPHCVCFREEEDLDALPWRRWGASLERHPAFADRTNVQVARVHDGGASVRIWERGAGETASSGSSACAVAAAAVHTGRLEPGAIPLWMPGGVLRVEVSPSLELVLRGPVEPVGWFELDPGWGAAGAAQRDQGNQPPLPRE